MESPSLIAPIHVQLQESEQNSPENGKGNIWQIGLDDF